MVEKPISALNSPTSMWPAVPATSRHGCTLYMLTSYCTLTARLVTSLAPAIGFEAVAADIRVTCTGSHRQSILARSAAKNLTQTKLLSSAATKDRTMHCKKAINQTLDAIGQVTAGSASNNRQLSSLWHCPWSHHGHQGRQRRIANS